MSQRKSWQYALTALAAVAVFAIAAVAGLIVRTPSVHQAPPPERVGLQVFVKPHAAEAEVAVVAGRLSSMPDIMSVRLIDQSEAYARAAILFAEEPDVMRATRLEEMPPSFSAMARQGADLDALAAEVRGFPDVVAVSFALSPSRFP